MAELKSRFSLSILSAVASVLRKEADAEKIETTDLIERILKEHVLKSPYLNPYEKDEIEMYHSLVERVADMAAQIVREQGFRDSITADTLAACMNDPQWQADYTSYIGDNPYKNGNSKKQNINPSFGYWVKKTLGAKSKMQNGKAMNRKILGAIIQSYTPLEI